MNNIDNFTGEFLTSCNSGPIITQQSNLIKILKLVTRIANTEANVVIFGETGTGKELIAHALHFYNNKRKNKLFIPINCSAFNDNLLESELFGHVRGAFTGANTDKAGLFEYGNGGTIFLDEVCEMSGRLQIKLLRILQTGEYNQVGSPEIKRCNVRFLAATNRNLEQLIKEGKFREDLYYRLNVLEIYLPPLRERKCDIICLARHFLRTYCNKYGKESLSLSSDVEKALLSYNFPGNVRELENIIQRSVIMTDGKLIEMSHLPNKLQINCEADATKKGIPKDFKISKKNIVEKFERTYVTDCLIYSQGNITKAANCAGIDVKNFSNKMKRYNIGQHYFK